MLESSVREMHIRDKEIKPDAFLVDFSDHVNSKLNVPIAPLEVVVYAAMIISAERGDYNLPKPWTDSGLGVMKMTMLHRSLSSQMAYEDHYDVITSPTSYLVTERPNHPMDYLITPEQMDN